MTLSDKSAIFRFQTPDSDEYPPHLSLGSNGDSLIPKSESVSMLQLFNLMRLLDTGTLLARVIPDSFEDFIHDNPEGSGESIQAVQDRERLLRAEHKDVYKEPSIGDRDDWFSDAVFAQTEFTGVNPTSLTIISKTPWLPRFQDAARFQNDAKVFDFLRSNQTSLYVSDCSYFREAVGITDQTAPLISTDGHRWGCASVCLYNLLPTGTLHPVGIVCDYIDSTDPKSETMSKSVCIFNKRLTPTSNSLASEKEDYPWRYAKNCVQTSDWLRHELAVHLTNAHLIEESVIVSAHLTLPPTHPVYKILEPHWLKTLSLNAAARSALIPGIAVKITGMTDAQTYAFIKDAYKRFNWVDHYIPNDLERRGFPMAELDNNPKFHNYAYARNMKLMWHTLRSFVASTLSDVYCTDDSVAKDTDLVAFVAMMRAHGGGQVTSFPDLTTRDALFDTVTMCIHIASPQHTSINYLQEYYQTFVIARPPSLYTPPPTSLSQLKKYKEADVLAAYPLKYPREYLLASHIGALLSSTVAQDQNLPNYAHSLHQIAKVNKDKKAEKIAKTFMDGLIECDHVFKQNSKELDDQTKAYDVINPGVTAVSILI